MPGTPKLVLADRAERVRFYEGDSFELLRSMPEESVDCVWTDPPYNLYNNGTTRIERMTVVKIVTGSLGVYSSQE